MGLYFPKLHEPTNCEDCSERDPESGLTLEDLIDAFITSPREAKALKLYLMRDKKERSADNKEEQNDPNNDI